MECPCGVTINERLKVGKSTTCYSCRESLTAILNSEQQVVLAYTSSIWRLAGEGWAGCQVTVAVSPEGQTFNLDEVPPEGEEQLILQGLCYKRSNP